MGVKEENTEREKTILVERNENYLQFNAKYVFSVQAKQSHSKYGVNNHIFIPFNNSTVFTETTIIAVNTTNAILTSKE